MGNTLSKIMNGYVYKKQETLINDMLIEIKKRRDHVNIIYMKLLSSSFISSTTIFGVEYSSEYINLTNSLRG